MCYSALLLTLNLNLALWQLGKRGWRQLFFELLSPFLSISSGFSPIFGYFLWLLMEGNQHDRMNELYKGFNSESLKPTLTLLTVNFRATWGLPVFSTRDFGTRSKDITDLESSRCLLSVCLFFWVNLLFICLFGKSPRTYIWSGNLCYPTFRVTYISQDCCLSPLWINMDQLFLPKIFYFLKFEYFRS